MSVLLAFLISTALAQDLTHEVVRHVDIADGRPRSMDEGFIGAYETQFDYVVSVGDIVALNVPTGEAARGMIAGGGAGGNGFGGGLATGVAVRKGYFEHVFNGTHAATVGKMALSAGLAGLGAPPDPSTYMAPESLSGAEVRIQRMKLAGTRKRPVVWMECELVNTRDKENASGIVTIADYDQAVRAAEVYNPNHITREIAIQRLKEAKDLLDIGVYTQEQFDAEKEKYGPYIE